MNFDIDSLATAAQKTYDVVVGHLPGAEGADPTPVGFTVVGPDSDQFRAAERATAVFGIQEAERRKAPLDLSKPEDAGRMYDGLEGSKAILLDHCVVGWFGFMQGDQAAAFTPENLRKVLRAKPHWARRLVGEIENAANFDGA